MAKQKHLKMLKKSITDFNKWREKNLESRPDLRDANLMNADLHKANLNLANLSEAKLIKANLYVAKLLKANLIEANLEEARLSWADLRGANFMAADLVASNLSGADLSGADITGANLWCWKIEGVKCTHIIWNDKKIDYDNPKDFEKVFTKIESVIEILLDLPLSELSYLTGRFIEQAINQKYGEGSILLKGQVAVSKDKTKFEYVIFAESNDDIRKQLLELRKQLQPVINAARSEEEGQLPFGLGSEIGIPFTEGALVVRPKELERLMIERYYKMHPLLQTITQTIQLHCR